MCATLMPVFVTFPAIPWYWQQFTGNDKNAVPFVQRPVAAPDAAVSCRHPLQY